MKKKRERDWLPVTVLLLTVLLLVLCLVGFAHHEPDGPDGNGKAAESELSTDELQVTFFDVGKSDAILVEQSGYRMLIDTSFDDQADVLLDYFADHGIDTLDYLIITHFDKDHVGGADKILDAMHVKRVLEPDYTVEKKQFREYREALVRNRITAMRITDVERRSLAGRPLSSIRRKRRIMMEMTTTCRWCSVCATAPRVFSSPETASRSA